MAKTETKNVLERTYTIPLRKEYSKVPGWRKTKKAVTALKQFLSKHMKSEDVKLGKALNDNLWKNGIKNPPHKVKVSVTKDDKGVVNAELFGVKVEKPAPKKEVKKETKIEDKEKEKSIEQKKDTGNKVSGGSKEPEAKVQESKEEAKTLQTDKPEPKVEKLPKEKDEKATQSVPSSKNQLN